LNQSASRQQAEREQQLRLVEGVDAFCTSVQDALQEPSFEVKQQVLRLVVDRIVVEDTQLAVHHVVPTGPVRLQTRQHPDGTLHRAM
jgi:site-specific DNA recombinase